jgi:hypothetical protein
VIRLKLGKLEMQPDNTASGRAHLDPLQKDATSKMGSCVRITFATAAENDFCSSYR